MEKEISDIITIQFVRGNGGEEAIACARLLYKMYLAFFDRISAEIKQEAAPVDAKNGFFTLAALPVTLDAEAFVKREAGIHQITRISPFDTQERRHTTFTQVIVNACYPDPDCVARNYVLKPYKKVTCMSTGRSSDLVKEVLRGDLLQLHKDYLDETHRD